MTTNKLRIGKYSDGADMTKLNVFFADRQTRADYNMLDKLEHVFDELGLRDSINEGEKVMIKTHFGLYGNTNHIRPAYVRKLVDLVRAAGGFRFHDGRRPELQGLNEPELRDGPVQQRPQPELGADRPLQRRHHAQRYVAGQRRHRHCRRQRAGLRTIDVPHDGRVGTQTDPWWR